MARESWLGVRGAERRDNRWGIEGFSFRYIKYPYRGMFSMAVWIERGRLGLEMRKSCYREGR